MRFAGGVVDYLKVISRAERVRPCRVGKTEGDSDRGTAMSGEPIQVLLVASGSAGERVERELSESGVAPFLCRRVIEQEALTQLEQDHIDVVLLHLSLQQALRVLPEVQRRSPSVPVVVLSDEDDESAAVAVVREGAQDFLVRSKTDGRSLAHGLRYAIERKRAEEALQKSEAFYHSLVESLPQNIFRKDLLGRFTFANGRFCAEMGRPLQEIVGKTDFDFFPVELAAKYRADDMRVIETSKAFEVVEEHVTHTGEKLYVQVIKMPVHDASGKLIGTQGIFWDVTEKFRGEEQLKRAYAELAAKEAELLKAMGMLKASHEELIQAQLQLIQAEKLESVGRLAAGVAHEVKNPLAILLMGLDYMNEEEMRDTSSDQEVMRAMRDAVHRADAIVRGLVDFSANRQLDATPQDLNQMIRRSLLLVKHELTGAHVGAVTDLESDLPPVVLDPNKIQQVFVNLFMNAIQAMPEGGSVMVRTYSRKLSSVHRDEGSRRAERFRAGDRVVIAEVEDTGTGIPPDKLSKVFDPFFTTKPTGRGTGLGLTVTRKIVELHNGSITLENRKEGGARVTLTFHAYGSQNHAVQSEHPEAQAHSGHR